MSSFLIRFARRRGLVPRISETERQALTAGTVWADGELFSGNPDFAALLAEEWPRLTERERAFLDGPVEELCRRIDPWELRRSRRIPQEVWDFLKAEGFFGLAIPEEYGGHGFSPLAQSTIFGKVACRSLALSAVVLIPNSVGPGELLLEYGTEAEKRHYLPRLARGEEIPCFALTEPEAGSDAASLTSPGVVFRGDDGEAHLRLDWDKRYITLAPVATLLGLAVRLEDPDELLGRGPEPGITLVLVPTDRPGVEIGRRHDPMGVPFPNGPTRGRDVVLPASHILGGPQQAGRGWKMLMEALSAGRSISLPAQSVGGIKKLARVAGAYAVVRRQFGVPIARFEGVEERLAPIAGCAYLMEAARQVTCGAVAAGHRSAVLSAVVKVQQTELLRARLVDTMDVLGGMGLFRGPRNPLGDAWEGAPIGITVEGANILTRSLIIFGQGLMRCHPYALAEVEALIDGDGRKLRRALLGHGRFFLGNVWRAFWRSLSRGRLAPSPLRGSGTGPGARSSSRWFRRLSWASARFAVTADLALFALGPKLKLKEKLSGRFADALSWMLLAFCALRRFEAEGRREEDLPLLEWSMATALFRVQEALEGVAANFEGPGIGFLMRTLGRTLLRVNPLASPPSDALGARVAQAIREPGELRDRLTADVYDSGDAEQADGRLERAFRLTVEAMPVEAEVRRAQKAGEVPKGSPEAQAGAAVDAGVITEAEATLLRQAAAARRDAVAVDEYSLEEYLAGGDAGKETGARSPTPEGRERVTA